MLRTVIYARYSSEKQNEQSAEENDIIKIKGRDIVKKQTKSRISLGKIIDFLFNATLFTGCLAPAILLISVIFGGLTGIILAVGIEFFLSLLFPLPDIVVSIIDWVFIGGTIICVFLYQLIDSLDVIIDKPVNINHPKPNDTDFHDSSKTGNED